TKLKREHEVELLFHGRLVERKGCTELIKALAYGNKNNLFKKDWFLHISGDGPDRKKLEKQVTKNDLAQNVKFHGRTTDDKKFKLMNLSDITLYPAMSGESFGVVTVEAMATAHPVVLAGNNPGYASVLSEAKGSLFDAKNTEEFARHLAKYINNPKARKILYNKQQKLVKKYDIKTVAKQVLKVYQDNYSPHKNK
ncbi:MAG: glycosyltransferase, partial [Patescibacteria group bacterium]